MAYRLSRAAQDDLNEILVYWLRTSLRRDVTNKLERDLRAKCRTLGQHPYMGMLVENTIAQIRVTQAIDGRFAIYYRPLGPRSVEVIMIKDNRQPRPTPNELNTRT